MAINLKAFCIVADGCAVWGQLMVNDSATELALNFIRRHRFSVCSFFCRAHHKKLFISIYLIFLYLSCRPFTTAVAAISAVRRLPNGGNSLKLSRATLCLPLHHRHRKLNQFFKCSLSTQSGLQHLLLAAKCLSEQETVKTNHLPLLIPVVVSSSL